MNEYIAAAVDELYELGVREAVISPGSRSTPLSMYFCEHNFKVYLDIDERSAGFFALGIAKDKCRPVALVCTSGSAATHYLPAVAEAKYSRVPLVILTADRPPELRNIGAPQTINQEKLFGEFINYYEELAISDQSFPVSYPRLVMRKAYLKSMSCPKGPVQINVPLKEPLVPDLNSQNFISGRDSLPFVYSEGEYRIDFDGSCFYGKNGVIVCGGDAQSDYQEEMIALGERLKAPVLADPLSNIRNYENDVIIDSYDAFLKNDAIKKALKPDYILLFGQIPVSKRLQEFLSLHKKAECFQIDEAAEYRNPSLTTRRLFRAQPKAFSRQISAINENSIYLNKWQELQIKTRNELEQARTEIKLFEGKIVQLLEEWMPEDSRLVVANSMSIRYIDFFWKAKNRSVKVLCNRGTNGIDGTISTALGISASCRPTVLLTGDLAFFHDMNGLLIGKTHKLNLVIILLNNNGGGIFQYLPQRESKHFDYLFSTPHDIHFEGVQRLYDLNYHRVTDYPDFQSSFEKAIITKGIHVIEIKTDMRTSLQLHEKYTKM